MTKRVVPFIFLLFICVLTLTSCPTKYEKRMAGRFYISKMELGGKSVDIDSAFSDSTVVLTANRKFSINIEFNSEYLDDASTYTMIKDSMRDKPTDQQVQDIIAYLKEGIYLTGTFSNNNGGLPVFTPNGTSKKPSEYGFNRFDYDFEKDILIVQGNKYVVTKFEFKKIK